MSEPAGSSSTSRNRGRWGGREPQPPPPAPSSTRGAAGPSSVSTAAFSSKSVSVSDQEALQALLRSAEEASLARAPPARSGTTGQQSARGRGGGRDGGRSNDRGGNASHKRRRDEGRQKHEDVGYYGPSQQDGPAARPGRPAKVASDDEQDAHSDDRDNPGRDADADLENKVKPDFGLSGALSKDVKTGNVYKGVLLKFREPPEARAPNTLWRLYVYKGDDLVETLHVNRQSAYLFGRHADICDVVLHHASCSTQHAVLQYRAVPHPTTKQLHCQPYLMDLESTNGTFLNGVRLDAARYYQLKAGDVLRFGASTREYVLLSASSNPATTKKAKA